MLDPNTKAAKAAATLQQVADELRAEGNVTLADSLVKGLKDMPVGSLARLHDLVENCETKAEALEIIQ